LRSLVGRRRQRGAWTTRTLVFGRDEAKRIVESFQAETIIGFEPVGTCGFEAQGLPSFETTELEEAVRSLGAGALLVVAEGLERSETRAAFEVADTLPVNVIVLPGLDYLLLGSLRLVTVGHEPGLALDAPSLRRYQADVKRAFDIVASAALLIASAPVSAVCALALWVESRGTVLFRQEREGLGGNTFQVIKFRTMAPGAEPVEHEVLELADEAEDVFFPKVENDPRTTRVGRFLRRTSLDELPQLWNVLRGDMSLVGPRPLSLWEAERLGLARRMVVRPGLTGLWQVSGRSMLSPSERIRLDLVYVQNWSLLLDLSILLRTVPAVIGRRGAY
jgi:exopolysaccharide biosynthesis polyprenyl glycosylphosphotransferase